MKKCGTKRGRTGDNDEEKIVLPAPDSCIKMCESEIKCATPDSHINKLNNSKAKKNIFDCSTPISRLKTNKPTSYLSSTKKRKLQFHENDDLNIPTLETSLSVICEVSELIELHTSRDDNHESQLHTSPLWKPELGLTLSDRDDLINNRKLNSNHMEAASQLLREIVGDSIGGLQLTVKVPVFDEINQKWIYKLPMDPAPQPSCQIHHNHKDHWVASMYYNNEIYVLDSLGNDRPPDRLITNGLTIQLSQIYGKDKNNIRVNIPSVIKQTNSTDCGLFAIAFITSFCLRKSTPHQLIYDSNKLRNHLLECFENNKMSEFPLTSKTTSSRRRDNMKSVIVDNYCTCNLPECVEDMIQCDRCNVWYHQSCVNFQANIVNAEQSFCCNYC